MSGWVRELELTDQRSQTLWSWNLELISARVVKNGLTGMTGFASIAARLQGRWYLFAWDETEIDQLEVLRVDHSSAD